MASFGNTGASSLLSSASAAASKAQALNDSLAAYQYELSPKDAAAFNTYQSYLTNSAQKASSDPSKTLSYEKALTSAQKSYTSAEISRASTQVDYGGIDNSQKYNIISQLRDAALQNGDEATAQSLEAKMAGLSVTIQNQAASAQSASDRATSKAQTANKAGVNQTAAKFDQQMKLAQEAVARGQLSVQDYQKFQAEALKTKAQLYQDAADGKYGDLGSSQTDFLDKANTITSSPAYLDAQKYYSQAVNGQPTKYLQVNPTNRDSQGLIGDVKALPGQRVVQNPDGTFSNSYLAGWQDKTDATGKNVATTKDREAFINSGKDFIFNNVVQAGQPKGSGGTLEPVGGQIIADPKNAGQYFVVDQNGAKHYVAADPSSTLQRSSTPITPEDASAGKGTQYSHGLFDVGYAAKTDWNAAKSALGAVAKVGGGLFGGPQSAIGGGVATLLLGAGQHAQDRAAAAAALAKAQAAQQAYTQALAQQQASAANAARAAAAPPGATPTILPAKGQIYYPSIGQPGYQSGVARALNNAPAPSAPAAVKATALVNNLMGYSPTNGK